MQVNLAILNVGLTLYYGWGWGIELIKMILWQSLPVSLNLHGTCEECSKSISHSIESWLVKIS